MIKPLLSVAFLAFAISHLHAQTFTLVKDIRPGATTSAPDELTSWNNKLYFRANNGANGNELFVTDGTDAGTMMVKDIRPGSAAGSVVLLSVLNNKLNFFANDGTSGTELWGSDGTEAGTVLIKDINAGAGSSVASFQATLNGFKYFDATEAVNGTELWRTDGTASGTTLVKAIATPGFGGSSPREMTTVGNLVFFYAHDGVSGYEMWKTDGTASGTTITRDINPGALPSSPEGNEIKGFNEVAYFRKSNGVNGVELWRSDGTEAGTYMVKDINPGAGNSTPYNFTVFNNALYFVASDGVSSKLWKTDGTEAGTVALGAAGGTYTIYGLNSMAPLNGFLYFPGVDDTHGTELWKTDGTVAGTTFVKDINPGTASSDIAYCINVGDKIVFRATTAASGAEPWVSDGTAQGTLLLQDIEPGSGSSTIERFVTSGNKLYALATTTLYGRELWVANNLVVLPLRFVSFSARQCGTNEACLTWKTADEQNVSHFDIERSTDGKNYRTVGSTNARNQAQNNYAITDDIAQLKGQKQVYYRIRQFDKDGKSKLSSIQSLPLKVQGISVYPTLASSAVTVVNQVASKASLVLMNTEGKIVLQQTLKEGINNIALDKLPKGFYFYRILTSENMEISTGKIVKE